jgi:hypothetical protein
MTEKLETVLDKVYNIPNPVNSSLTQEFYQFMADNRKDWDSGGFMLTKAQFLFHTLHFSSFQGFMLIFYKTNSII